MKQVQFRCSQAIFQRYSAILQSLDEAEDYSDDHYSLIDELQSLPGFPRGVDVNTRVSVYIDTVRA